MDPKANMEEQLALAREFYADAHGAGPALSPVQIEDKALRLAELVLALHEWQRFGGFSPYAKPEPVRGTRGTDEQGRFTTVPR